MNGGWHTRLLHGDPAAGGCVLGRRGIDRFGASIRGIDRGLTLRFHGPIVILVCAGILLVVVRASTWRFHGVQIHERSFPLLHLAPSLELQVELLQVLHREAQREHWLICDPIGQFQFYAQILHIRTWARLNML